MALAEEEDSELPINVTDVIEVDDVNEEQQLDMDEVSDAAERRHALVEIETSFSLADELIDLQVHVAVRVSFAVSATGVCVFAYVLV